MSWKTRKCIKVYVHNPFLISKQLILHLNFLLIMVGLCVEKTGNQMYNEANHVLTIDDLISWPTFEDRKLKRSRN